LVGAALAAARLPQLFIPQSVFDDPRLLGIGDAAAMGSLNLSQKHPRADPLEAADPQGTQLSAIEGHFEQARSAGEARAVKELTQT
jgi:hypothetical protein